MICWLIMYKARLSQPKMEQAKDGDRFIYNCLTK